MVEEKRISAYTKLAIQTYRKRARMERRLQEIEVEHRNWLVKVPEEDMDYYVQTTDEIQKREDAKLEVFMRRLGKKLWER